MTFKPLFGPITILSLSFVTFWVSRLHVSYLTHETFKLGLQNTLNMSKTTRVYFGVLHFLSTASWSGHATPWCGLTLLHGIPTPWCRTPKFPIFADFVSFSRNPTKIKRKLLYYPEKKSPKSVLTQPKPNIEIN